MPKRDLDSLYASKKGIVRSFHPGDPVYVRRGDAWGDAAVVHSKLGPSTYKIKFTNGRIAVFNQNNIKYRNAGFDDEAEARIEAYEQVHQSQRTFTHGNETSPDTSWQRLRSAPTSPETSQLRNETTFPSENAQPSTGDSSLPTTGDGSGDGPVNQGSQRRSTRSRRKPAWLKDYVQ